MKVLMLVKRAKPTFPIPTALYLRGAEYILFPLIYFKQLKEKSWKRDELGEEGLYPLRAVLFPTFYKLLVSSKACLICHSQLLSNRMIL